MNLSISTDQSDESGKELLEYGTREYPVAFFYDDLDIVTIPWHWHEELEFIYILTGTEEVQVGDDLFRCEAGDGYFINSGVLHSARKVTQKCIQEATILRSTLLAPEGSIFEEKYARPLLQCEGLPYVHLRKDVPEEAELLSLMDSAWKAGAREVKGGEFVVRENLSRVLYGLSTKVEMAPPARTSGSTVRTRQQVRLKQMLAVIDHRYMENLSIGEIADGAHISVSECLRTFKKYTGTTPIQFLIEKRLEKAAEKIRMGDQRISLIAESCGFHDMSYFTRMFRKSYGKTPSDYRREYGD